VGSWAIILYIYASPNSIYHERGTGSVSEADRGWEGVYGTLDAGNRSRLEEAERHDSTT
jgi:hypothetical protein